MANRYWVGGSGTWDTTSTTNWSASSGGSSGATVPTTADNVYFDQASTYTVTMTGALNCLSFNVTAGTVTFQNGTTPTLTVAGGWSTTSSTVWNTTGAITFTATAGYSITSNGITFNSPITFNSSSGIWTLGSDLTLGSTLTLTLTAGTLGLSTYTLTTGLFASSGTSTRTIAFSTGKIVLTSATTSTIWNTGTITSLSVTGTSKLVECQGGGAGVTKTINTGALSEANAISFSLLETSGTVTYAFTASNVIKNLIVNGSQTVSNIAITIYGAFTHQTSNGTTTFTAGANAWTFAATSGSYTITPIGSFTYDFPWTFGSAASTATWTLAANLTLGTTRTATLTTGTLALSTFTLTTGLFASSGTGVRTLNFGTGKIVVNSATTSTVWTTATVTNLTVSGTPLVECQGGGSAVTKTINTGALSEANAISFSLLETTGTATYAFTASNVVKNLTINGVQTLSNIAITIYGSLTHSTANGTTTFTAGANAWTFGATSGSYTITNLAATTYDFPWTFGSAASTATWTLAANLTLGATRQLSLVNGTTDFNSKTISAAGITILTGTPTIANTGTASFTTTLPITHTSGTLTLPFNITTSSASGYTLTGANATLALGTYTLTTPVFSSSGSLGRTLDFGTGKIVLNGTATATIWNTGTPTNLTVSGTPLVECIGGGSAVTKTINTGTLTEAQAISFSLLETTGTVTYAFTASNAVKNLIINGLQTLSNIAITIYGSFTHSTANGTTTFTAGANAWTFGATSGSYTITNLAGTTYDFPWTFGSGSASQSTTTWTLAANLTLGATRQLTLQNGTTDFNSKTLSAAGITVAPVPPVTATLSNTGSSTFSTTLPFSHTRGTFAFTVNVTTTSASGYTLNTATSAATLSFGNYTLTTPVFSSSGSTGLRTLAFGSSGQLALTGNNTTIFDITTTTTNFTTTGTVYINCTYTGSTGTRTIATDFSVAQAAGYTVSFSGTTGIVLSSSATDTIALTGTFDTLNFTGFTGTLSNTARTTIGNFTIPASGGTYTAGTNATTLGATSGTKTITTNGVTLDFPVTFNGVGGTFQLADALTLGSTRTATLTNGTLDLNNYTLSAQIFSSNNNNTRTIAFGTTGKITVVGNNATIIDFTDMTNFTYTGTPKIYSTYNGATGTRTFNFGSTAGDTESNTFDVSIGTTGNGLVITAGTDTIALTGGYGSVDLSAFTQTLSNTGRTIYGNLTIPATGGTYTAGSNTNTFGATSGTKTITTNGRTLDFPIAFNGTGGTFQLAGALTIGSTRAATLTSGTLDLNNFTLTAGTLSSNNTNARTIAFGTTGKITVVGNNATLVDFANMTNSTFTGTPKIYSTYNGATGTRTFTFGGPNLVGFTSSDILDVSIGSSGNGLVITAGTDTIALTGGYGIMDLTGLTMTLANSGKTIFGNLTLPASGGAFSAGLNDIVFSATSGIQTITTNGRTLDFPVTFDGVGGTFQLAGALTIGSTRTATLTNGTLDLNNFTLTAATLSSNNTNTRAIAFGTTGKITLSGNNTTIVDFTNNMNGFTYTGTPKIYSTYTGATGTRTFNFGGTGIVGAISTNTFDVTIGTTGNGLVIAAGTDALSFIGGYNNFDLTGLTNTVSNSQNAIYGNYTIPASGGTFTAGAANVYFSTSTTTIITTNGRTLDFPFTFNGSGTYRLAGALTLGGTRIATLTSGTLDLNDFTFTINILSSNNSNSRAITFGTTGKIVVVASSNTIVDFTTMTGFTYTGTPKIYSTYNGATGTRTFNCGGTAGFTSTNTFDVSIGTTGNGLVITAGTDTIALTGGYGSVNLTGTTMTLSNTIRTIYGNLTIPSSGGTYTAGTNATTFGATTGTQTITTNGVTLAFPHIFNGVGGNWTLANNLVANATTALTLTNGQVDFNQKALTFANITVLTGNAGLSNLNTTLNFVHTSGNLTVVAGAITTTTSGTYTIAAGTLSANAAFTTGAFTQNGGNVIINGGDLTTTTFSSTGSTTRSIQLANGNINVTSTGTVVNMTTTTGLTANGTGNIQITSAGSTAITVTPGSLAEANTINYKFTGGTYALTLTAGNVKNLNFTGYAGTVGDSAMTIYGNLTLSTGMTRTAGTSAYTFASTSGTQYLTSNGKTLDCPITINGVGANIVINDAFTSGATRTVTLSNGTLNLNGFTFTAGNFTVGAGTKNITFNAGTLAVAANGATAFNMANPTGFTTTKGTGSGAISMTSSTAKTFVGNALTYNCYLDQGGAGDLTVTSLNTFDGIKSSYATTTANANIILPAGNTTILTGITGGSTATKLLGLKGVDSYTRANIVISNTANQSASYVQTRSVLFNAGTFVTDGTTPFRWYLANSVNNGDTFGAVFADNSTNSAPIIYFINSGTSWTVPSNWDSANNIIHIFGAGGGSAGSRTPDGAVSGNVIGSGGGGGGGYTKITNFSATPLSTVSYSIGAGGTAGVANSATSTGNGGAGGSTTFSTYSAGGGGGSSHTDGATTAGTGGVGSTYNGGAGGAGSFTTNATYNSGGGGGGGAGGPFGVGQVGGNGANAGNPSTTAGGGGGGTGGGTAGTNAVGATPGVGGNNYNSILVGGAGGLTAANGVAANSLGFASTDVLSSIGGGGGAGGAGAYGPGQSPGNLLLGAGAGGAGATDAGYTNPGAVGGSGGIIITYYACTSPVFNSAMFLVF